MQVSAGIGQGRRVYPYGTRHTPEMAADVSRRAWEYRIQVLCMLCGIESGRIGGAFSMLRLDPADEIHGRPAVIMARSTKGKGVRFMRNDSRWHGGIPTDGQFQAALEDLRGRSEQWAL